ncbi:hypothetical protein [Cereibacter azotoformans]|uniref:hypothetical protein n=1 Tax=Cereibacter azotoformans TaxID=43057 RepID=UPI00117BAB5A|nr:hypothetical protein [Cereibacter azotoformans]
MTDSLGVAGVALAVALAGPARAETLLNVSYDPTRELYREVNEAFAARWQAEGHEAPKSRPATAARVRRPAQ